MTSLGEERNKHIGTIMTLEEKLSDLEVQCASLDARLNQRNAQLGDLQREISEKANEVTALEREVYFFKYKKDSIDKKGTIDVKYILYFVVEDQIEKAIVSYDMHTDIG